MAMKTCYCFGGQEQIIEDIRNGCSICLKCGVVVEESFIDVEHEAVRSFEDGEDHSQTFCENEFASSTVLLLAEYNPSASNENREMAQTIMKLNKESNTEMKVKEKKSAVMRRCSALNVSKRVASIAIEIAGEYETKRKKFSKGETEALPIAAIYCAYKIAGSPRPLKEIAGGNVTLKKVNLMMKKLSEAKLESMNIKEEVTQPANVSNNSNNYSHSSSMSSNTTTSSPSASSSSVNFVIERVCYRLRIPYPHQRQITKVVAICADFLAGKHPKTIVAASLQLYQTELQPILEKPFPQISNTTIALECDIDISTLRCSFTILKSNKEAIQSKYKESPEEWSLSNNNFV